MGLSFVDANVAHIDEFFCFEALEHSENLALGLFLTQNYLIFMQINFSFQRIHLSVIIRNFRTNATVEIKPYSAETMQD